MRKQIPDRWDDYSRSGSIIEGTKIICFKVPLKKAHEGLRRWNVKEVLKEIPDLGAVIDLTNTTRYYDPKDFVEAGVRHIKIAMEGRIIPPKHQVNKFIETVEELLKNNVELIGVHCTHGLNRTGYMVCRYMRDCLKVPAKEAISRFESARGHAMERANYISDLLGHKVIPPPDLGGYNHIKNERRQKNQQTPNERKPHQIKHKNWRDRKDAPADQNTSRRHFWSSQNNDRSHYFGEQRIPPPDVEGYNHFNNDRRESYQRRPNVNSRKSRYENWQDSNRSNNAHRRGFRTSNDGDYSDHKFNHIYDY